MSVLILSLAVAMLAVTRVSMFIVNDQLTVGLRRWVVRRWGEASMPTYLIHCNWCISIWVAAPIMMVAGLFPHPWVIAILSIPAASLAAGLLSQLRE